MQILGSFLFIIFLFKLPIFNLMLCLEGIAKLAARAKFDDFFVGSVVNIR